MRIALYVIFSITVLLYLTQVLLSIFWCDVGFLGHPDTWYSKKAEKVYTVLCIPVTIGLLSIIILMIHILT